MKLNWAERWVVNNPARVVEQRIELRRLRRMMPLAPGFRALEIGCGRGAGAGLILEEYQPSTICATDLDAAMMERAKQYLPADKRKRIILVAADGSRLPFRAGSLDAVFDFGVLHHIPCWRSAMAEIRRVLKPGGAFLFEEIYPTLYQNFITRHILLHPREDRFNGDDLRAALKDNGLILRQYSEWRGIGILGVAVRS